MYVKTAIWGVVFMVLALASSPAYSQVYTVNVDIPFDFGVKNRVFPAGEYVLVPVEASRTVFRLASTDGEFATMIMAIPAEGNISHAAAPTRLLFKKYPNNAFFLSQVWWREAITGREFLPSNAERELLAGFGRPLVAMVLAD